MTSTDDSAWKDAVRPKVIQGTVPSTAACAILPPALPAAPAISPRLSPIFPPAAIFDIAPPVVESTFEIPDPVAEATFEIPCPAAEVVFVIPDPTLSKNPRSFLLTIINNIL